MRSYNWKSKFGGMMVSEAQRLKALKAENAKLKDRRVAVAYYYATAP
jgi:hypothetical protein